MNEHQHMRERKRSLFSFSCPPYKQGGPHLRAAGKVLILTVDKGD